MLNIVTKISSWQELRKTLQSKTIGFVPTMGNLHQGHIRLCERAKKENDLVVASIFINPTQFNQAQDFERYPRTLEQDQQLLQKANVDYLFAPDAFDMYPDQFEVQVSETNIAKILEGEHRPGHFTGMLTVVLKLLNLVSPTKAYFGEKDYQQLCLIKKMAKALFLPCEIINCETIRTYGGLALSSRNNRLDDSQKTQAQKLNQVLSSDLSLTAMKSALEQDGFKVEYIEEQWNRRLAAAWLGEVRLIDNVLIKEETKC